MQKFANTHFETPPHLHLDKHKLHLMYTQQFHDRVIYLIFVRVCRKHGKL